jgi:hypothetical protein
MLLIPRLNTAILLISILIADGAELKLPLRELQSAVQVLVESCFVYIDPSIPISKASRCEPPETTTAKLL